MEATEALMADQLDAIIRRLTERIEAGSEHPRRETLKKRLRQMRNIRSRFDDTK